MSLPFVPSGELKGRERVRPGAEAGEREEGAMPLDPDQFLKIAGVVVVVVVLVIIVLPLLTGGGRRRR